MPKPKLPKEGNQMPPTGGNIPPIADKKARRRANKQEKRAKRRKTDPDVPGDPDVVKKPLADKAAKDWAVDVLTGEFDKNELYHRMTDPNALDPEKNEALKSVIEGTKRELQEDWLGNLTQLTEQAEASGRYGGGLYGAMRVRETEETQEAAADAISKMLAGAYENERNRQNQTLANRWQAEASAARIPIEFGNLDVNRGQLNVARGQLGLARSEFGFNKKMALLGAQQDAVNDYMAILGGLGSMGGSQWGTSPGQFVPSQNPWAAALMGGVGGYTSMGGTFGGGSGQVQNHQFTGAQAPSGNNTPTQPYIA